MLKLHTKIDGGISKLTFIFKHYTTYLYKKIFQNTSEYMCLLLKITFPPFLYIHIFKRCQRVPHENFFFIFPTIILQFGRHSMLHLLKVGHQQ